ncbi:hypothetical protein [Polaromonas aquatica]|uniref:hypothetical protein n=1 Tax=Polaromonas aquatica TaxID=332657 RepID=UPI003D650085
MFFNFPRSSTSFWRIPITAVITETVSVADAGVSHAKPAALLDPMDWQPPVETASGLEEGDLLGLWSNC